MKKKQFNNGLFIGRFQPFHKGHLEIIKKASKECKKIIIAIGSAQYKNTPHNPFSANERKKMIELSLKKLKIKNYKIIQINDIHSDKDWVEYVLKKISIQIKSINKINLVYVAQNKKTQKLFSQKGFKTKTCKRLMKISGIKIRKMMMANSNDEIRKISSEKNSKTSKYNSWQNYVPAEVAGYIKKIKGTERIAQF